MKYLFGKIIILFILLCLAFYLLYPRYKFFVVQGSGRIYKFDTISGDSYFATRDEYKEHGWIKMSHNKQSILEKPRFTIRRPAFDFGNIPKAKKLRLSDLPKE